jgi:enoyl-CoA hydratase/carnithine racemase
MGEYATMLYSKEGTFLTPVKNIAVIKLNRPDALNAINDQFILDLNNALDEAENDPDIRSVIIGTAHPKVFCTGADLKMAQGFLSDTGSVAGVIKQGQDVIDKIAKMSKPVIAAIHGLCLGGGTEIALACDIRICDTDSKIGTPEVGLGLIPAWGGCVRMTRVVGLGKALELVLTGAQLTANEALTAGLVSKVVSPDDLQSEAVKYAMKFGQNAPVALKLAKRATHMAFEANYEDNLSYQVEAAVECFKTADLGEGIAAILEKRQPKFKGK